MIWWSAIATLGLLLLLVARVLWRASHPRPGVLGTTDLAYEVSRSLAWSADGGRFILEGIDRDAEVVLTRRSPGSGADELHVEIRGSAVNRCDLASPLEEFGLTVRSPQDEQHGLVLSGLLPKQATARHLVDTLLRVAGLAEGERFRYRFEGELDAHEMQRQRF